MGTVEFPDDQALPPLREELQVLRGAPLISGSPSWLIFDPIRHKYFQIGQDVFGLLAHWTTGTVGRLRERLAAEGTSLDDERLARLISFLHRASLTLTPAGGAVKSFKNYSNKEHHYSFLNIFRHYLFFRITLLRPSRFFIRTLWLVEPFFSSAWWVFVGFLGCAGVYLTSRQWDEFTTTFLKFFSLEGAVFYGLALIFVKIFHELGHAYAATRFGCRVPTMGVAFVVLWPILYTDTTDAWRLRARCERLIIDFAGVLVEMMLAGIALFLWAFLDDGLLRSIFFAISTISILSSIFVNLNPFMRFDGYYILSDFLSFQNMQTRAFDLGRWRLREFLFGVGRLSPEALPASYVNTLVCYAWAAWIYRLFFYLTILTLVFSLLPKTLAVVLCVFSIYWLFFRPIWSEIEEWWRMSGEIFHSKRSWVTFFMVATIITIFTFPWRNSVRVQGVMEASTTHRVYSSYPGRIIFLNLREGAQISRGDLIVRLEDPELSHEIRQTERRVRMLEEQVRRGAMDRALLAQARIADTELAAARQSLLTLRDRRSALSITAQKSGVARDVDPSLAAGLWLPERAVLGEIVGEGSTRIRAFVSGNALARLDREKSGSFVPDDPTQEIVEVKLTTVSSIAADVIDLNYVVSTYGGEISVDQVEGEQAPREAQYQVIAKVISGNLVSGRMTRGALRLPAEPESFAYRLFRRAAQLFIREAGV